MRLIHTRTLVLHEFFDSNVPKYAILSHRWVEGEVTFQEYRSLSDGEYDSHDPVRSKPGYEKIMSFCRQISKDAIEFGWVDTCCIDKTSSAELSEAINSMYRWYQNAARCYVYFSDVEAASKNGLSGPTMNSFVQSQWFTRGWTLQELIAPTDVLFFASNWETIGTKAHLAEVISRITKIDVSLLKNERQVDDYSVACRMSWASNRSTTREEDLAYCLMGIFDVNMPMLYGEGRRAFIRLQEEILRTSNDHTIFAWKNTAKALEDHTGLLAELPECFNDTGHYRPAAGSRPESLLVTLTNNGISLRVPILASNGVFRAVLNCHHQSEPLSRPYIDLVCLNVLGSQFIRVGANTLEETEADACRQQIYVQQSMGLTATARQLHQPIKSFNVAFDMKYLPRGYFYHDPKMPVYSCWISPQSYVIQAQDPSLAASSATRTRWTRGIVEATSWAVTTRDKDKYANFATIAFTLPQFPDSPAMLVEYSQFTALIGRAYDGAIGIQEAPVGLLLAVKQNRVIPGGLFPTDFEAFESLNTPKKLTARDGAIIEVQVVEGAGSGPSPCDYTLFVSLVQPARSEEKTFAENMRDYERRKRIIRLSDN